MGLTTKLKEKSKDKKGKKQAIFSRDSVNGKVSVRGRQSKRSGSPASPRGRQGQSRSVIECFDPGNGKHLGRQKATSTRGVHEAVAKARESQEVWKRTSFSQRRAVLTRMLDHVLDHIDELCRVTSRDAGKTLENSALGEIWPVCEKLRWTLKNGKKYLRPERVSSGLLLHKKAFIEYHPLGVVGIIAPWNYPLQNILGPVIPALMAGNGCVVKVSEAVAWSSTRFKRIFDEVLAASGLPTDLVQIINGYGATGEALVHSPIDLLIFTGSMENGRRVVEGSAEHLIPVILELGGNDPMIICDDAALEEAVHSALAGAFIACGQNCLAAERILVFEGIYDLFLERVKPLVDNLRQGYPLGNGTVDLGAIVSPFQVDIIEALVNDAVKKGASILTGGKRVLEGQGQYFAPTILTDVTEDMEIWRRETFGPVMVIRKVKDEKEAIAVANDIHYGLSSTVFTRSSSRAKRLARDLQAGSTCINGFGITYMAQDLPFGGTKGSGYGRLNGREGLRALTNQKAVLYDRFPLHLPPRLYPVRSGHYERIKASLDLIYRRGLGKKFKALLKLLSLFFKS